MGPNMTAQRCGRNSVEEIRSFAYRKKKRPMKDGLGFPLGV
jgi:hypothetical protein